MISRHDELLYQSEVAMQDRLAFVAPASGPTPLLSVAERDAMGESSDVL